MLRHRVAVDNWLQASFRAMQLLGRHSAEVGVAIRRRLPTGEVVSAATNDALHIGSAFDVTARFAGAVVSYVVVAVILLRSLRAARARRAPRRARAWCCCSARCCAPSSAASTRSGRWPAS